MMRLGFALREVTTQLPAVGGRACGKGMFLQVTRDHPSCCRVVIDDQDVSGFAVAGLRRAIHLRSIRIGFELQQIISRPGVAMIPLPTMRQVSTTTGLLPRAHCPQSRAFLPLAIIQSA